MPQITHPTRRSIYHCLRWRHPLHRLPYAQVQRWVLLGSVAIGLGGILGCGSDVTGPGNSRGTGDFFWALRLNDHAITLSSTGPDSTRHWQLVATPLTALGDTLATTAKVRFTSSDSAVLVDSTGLLTAHSARNGVKVIATLTVPSALGQSVTLVDTAIVTVTKVIAPPVFARFSVLATGGLGTLSVSALDTLGATISPVNVFYEVRDSTGLISQSTSVPGSSTPNFGRTLTVSATAVIYGVRRTDSVSIVNGWDIANVVYIDTVLATGATTPTVFNSSSVVRVGVGGAILFSNRSGRQIDLVFDDPGAAGAVLSTDILALRLSLSYGGYTATNASGNVLLAGGGKDARKFTTAGSYSYHSVQYPMVSGTILVQ